MLHDLITNLEYQYILNPHKFFIEAICSFIAISFCLYIIVSLVEYIISKNKKPIRHYFRITILRTETILLLAFCFMLPTFLNAYTFWYNVPEVAHFTSYMRLKTTRYALVQYGNGSVIGKNIKSNKKITWDDYSIVHSTHISKPYIAVTRYVPKRKLTLLEQKSFTRWTNYSTGFRKYDSTSSKIIIHLPQN